MKVFGYSIQAILASMALVLAGSLQAQETGYSAYHDYRIVTVAEGLVRPWSIAFLPGGEILVTEKSGRLRIIRDGELLKQPVAGVPGVFAEGQGDLLDVVPHPDFVSNRLIYLSYANPLGGGESTTAVVRGVLQDDRITELESVFEAQTQGRGHY